MKIFVLLAMLATAVSLILGVRSMAHGGDEDRRDSGRYMNARVGFQALALLMLLLALFIDMQ